MLHAVDRRQREAEGSDIVQGVTGWDVLEGLTVHSDGMTRKCLRSYPRDSIPKGGLELESITGFVDQADGEVEAEGLDLFVVPAAFCCQPDPVRQHGMSFHTMLVHSVRVVLTVHRMNQSDAWQIVAST